MEADHITTLSAVTVVAIAAGLRAVEAVEAVEGQGIDGLRPLLYRAGRDACRRVMSPPVGWARDHLRTAAPWWSSFERWVACG